MFKYKGLILDVARMEDAIRMMYNPVRDQNYDICPEWEEQMNRGDFYQLLVLGHAKGGDLEALRFLIEQKKCSLAMTDEEGNTPLIIAAKYGYQDIVGWMLNSGADANATNASDKNASEIAEENDHLEIAEMIRHSSTLNYR